MYKWINLIFYAGMLVINGLASFGKLNGVSTGEVSKEYGSLITPAGWTFSIWGAVYLLLLFFVVVPFIKPDGSIAKLGANLALWFPLSCALNILWITLWHGKRIVLSWAVMIALFLVLYFMFAAITKGTYSIAAGAGISVYFGWICVAMLANTMAMAVSLGLDGFGTAANIITTVMLCLGAVMIALINKSSGNIFFAAAAIWGYIGVLYKHIAKNELNGKYLSVIIAASAGILCIAAVLAVTGLSKTTISKRAEQLPK